MFALFVALVSTSLAIYYRELWKKTKREKENILKNRELWEWWRE
tara:strand:- start:939 stop:1070 length:132 start_codon:yes stop_codon:yes gene_type:complete